ncbi:hypothetical protein V6N12_075696 [Hibiscus sabdariffa]|uniref:Uncharacterized protein n=1 Tax=Hibiscus sabdariffa TaxID=183260 RepID=A0ABR2C914_9ROSI
MSINSLKDVNLKLGKDQTELGTATEGSTTEYHSCRQNVGHRYKEELELSSNRLPATKEPISKGMTGKTKPCLEKWNASEETSAVDVLSRCSNEMLNPMLTITNNKGSSGAHHIMWYHQCSRNKQLRSIFKIAAS